MNNKKKIKIKIGIYQNTKLWDYQSPVEAHRLKHLQMS